MQDRTATDHTDQTHFCCMGRPIARRALFAIFQFGIFDVQSPLFVNPMCTGKFAYRWEYNGKGGSVPLVKENTQAFAYKKGERGNEVRVSMLREGSRRDAFCVQARCEGRSEWEGGGKGGERVSRAGQQVLAEVEGEEEGEVGTAKDQRGVGRDGRYQEIRRV